MVYFDDNSLYLLVIVQHSKKTKQLLFIFLSTHF